MLCKMYVCMANKSYKGSRDTQQNYNHLGVDRALETLKNGQEGVTGRPENGTKTDGRTASGAVRKTSPE